MLFKNICWNGGRGGAKGKKRMKGTNRANGKKVDQQKQRRVVRMWTRRCWHTRMLNLSVSLSFVKVSRICLFVYRLILITTQSNYSFLLLFLYNNWLIARMQTKSVYAAMFYSNCQMQAELQWKYKFTCASIWQDKITMKNALPNECQVQSILSILSEFASLARSSLFQLLEVSTHQCLAFSIVTLHFTHTFNFFLSHKMWILFHPSSWFPLIFLPSHPD